MMHKVSDRLLINILLASIVAISVLCIFYQWTYASEFSIGIKVITLVGVGISSFLIYFINKNLFSSLENIALVAKNISEGNLGKIKKSNQPGMISDIAGNLATISDNINDATTFAMKIGEGDYNCELTSLHTSEGLGKALSEMRLKLKNVADEEHKRNWSINGIAKFSELLRDNQNLRLEEISSLYLKSLVKYMNANQGGVYLINSEIESEKFIELIACYAYDRKKFLTKRIEMNEGLIGQCVLENEYIYMEDVPDNYVSITSGLGLANPRCVLLVPIKVNDKIFGVIEIASFSYMEPHYIKFIEAISEGFASTIANVNINEHTQKLLDESRKVAQELMMKEESLRQNTEELVATQEELNHKVIEIERESVLTRSIVEAINKSNASVELDMNGNILTVNEMFLSIMEYNKEDLIGKPEKQFVAADEITTNRYSMMWDSIRKGSYNSGEFKRISKSGRELWLTGTYSPIFDIEGKPYKIILFAQFTTEQKEKELEFTSKINAVNQSIPIVEINLEKNIMSANPVFLNEFGMKRADIRNKEFIKVVDTLDFSTKEFENMWGTLLEGNGSTKLIGYVCSKGCKRRYMSHFHPCRNLAGEVHKVLVTMHDLTDQIKYKEQLKSKIIEDKQKNAVLNLGTGISQEVVNKLGDILLCAECDTSLDLMKYMVEEKSMPMAEIANDGKILVANNPLLTILNLNESDLADTGKNLLDYIAFKEQTVRDKFQKQILKAEYIQMPLTLKSDKGMMISCNIFFSVRMLPKVKPDMEEFTLVMCVMNVQNN